MSPYLDSTPAPGSETAPAMQQDLAAPRRHTRAELLADPLALAGPVVLATDGRGGDAALRAAVAAAQRLGVALEVIAVVQPLPDYIVGAGLPPLPTGFEAERRAELEEAVRRRLTRVVGERGWRLHVRYGDPARTVAELARERQASVIVVGIGRHAPLDRVFGSETALRVVRLADRPVLAVAAGFEALPTRALAATDFSPASVRAAQVAARLLQPGGTLTVVHVGPDPEALRGTAAEDWARGWSSNLAALFDRMRDAIAPDLRDGVTLATRQASGGVAEAVLAAAAADGAQLVASGTYGPGVVERLVVGSVATALLRGASGSVLVVPPPSPAQRAELRLRMAGTVETDEPKEWAETLDLFTRRNASRRATLEVDDAALGAQLEQRGWAFLGATYDAHDARVELMFGDPASATRHLTRSIPHARGIGIHADARGRDQALRVEHDGGQTMVTFLE